MSLIGSSMLTIPWEVEGERDERKEEKREGMKRRGRGERKDGGKKRKEN